MPTPTFKKYGKNSLRPNPHAADPERGDLAYAQGSSTTGDFGDESASASRTVGLPPEAMVQAEGQGDPTAKGFIPAPGGTPLLLGAQVRTDVRPPRGRSA